MDKYIIEMKDIVKNFGTVQAIKSGNFNLRKGEIHSLIGENGAGKSTMMKLLYGMYEYDSGTILVNGEQLSKITPKIAIEKGIGMVHQELMLINELTVLENIILGFEPKKGLRIDFSKAKEEVQQYIDRYGMDVEINKRINQISLGEAQRVEIIKTLLRGAEIIILDEPTAVLTPQESKRLFEILRILKENGKSIIFISHKLNEVMEISDRITVMRQGRYMDTVNKEETTEIKLTQLMIGREVFMDVKKTNKTPGKEVLKVENLWTSGEKEISKIRGVSFNVRSGEIVGIAGIDGNGQSELIEAITGLRKTEKGKVTLEGKDITNLKPIKIRRLGLSHIPEDRNKHGLNRSLSIRDNIVATQIDQSPFSKGMIRSENEEKKYSELLIKKFDIRPNDSEILTSSLSGGNAQKIVVAREVSTGKSVLVASQPTRGVDIGAIESIRNILEDAKAKGLGILLISADLEEIMSLSDRILVMYEGKITGELEAGEANEKNLGMLMMGGKINNDEGGTL